MDLSLTELQQLKQLQEQAVDSSRPRETIDAAQRAVELATRSRSSGLILDARLCLTTAFILAGKIKEALPEFVWCLTEVEQNDVPAAQHELLTATFSLLLSQGTGVAEISAEQFDQLTKRFETMLDSGGHSISNYYRMQMKLASSKGDLDLYERSYELYLKYPGKSFLECNACTLNNAVQSYFCFGDYEKAWEISQPILDGSMSCGEVPHTTFGSVLRSLIEMGEIELAEKYHQQGVSSMEQVPRLLDEYAPHVAYLVYRLRWEELNPLVNALLKWTGEISSSMAKLRFYYAVRPMTQRCPESQFAVRMPNGQRVNRERFASRVEDKIKQLAAALDQRNKNDFASTRMALPYTFPLSASDES